MDRSFPPVTPPPLASQSGTSFPRLVQLMQRLLAPDGCPWDRQQNIGTLRRYVIEEACEVADAIDGGDRGELCTELGDLLFQVVFQAELARVEGVFGPDDVIAAICDKLVRRHPHVFAGNAVQDAEEALRTWEKIKATERARARKGEGLLSSVPRSLPALMRAQRIGEKVARVGFDWPDMRGSRSKVAEELGELDEALAQGDVDAIEAELGDLFFALVNLARHAGVDAEGALVRTINKFTRRFEHVEKQVTAKHGAWPPLSGEPLSLAELDGYWEDAKLIEDEKSDLARRDVDGT
ncbi:nucleoside triphosphate pyrophosphohydrolase [Chondromyces crocatus]|uniref:Nucleoside triphosphate pyrophosphohydrolase n=1 Tax=Chondromyces crocatus TaxID=52 RepID=A0A0K1EDX5_CHOCO|nr:nucleoside triphosphate pyrophosphohydrolase [Chondromyces crocatus]AKT39061.1 nucleoside triphosphate pyrophosphohydrolase [Chondromyces crocatus]